MHSTSLQLHNSLFKVVYIKGDVVDGHKKQVLVEEANVREQATTFCGQ